MSPHRTPGRGARAALLPAAAITLAFALIGPCIVAGSADAAAPTHPFLPALSHEGPFEDACGAATDSHGDLYVAAYYDQEVRVFSPAGAPLAEFSAKEPCGLAVDSVGDVYVTTWGEKVVKYVPEGGEYPPTTATGYEVDTAAGTGGTISEAEVTSVAVDPANDHVYLVEEGSHISSYEADGTPIETGIGESVGPGHSYYGVDVYGDDGDVYVTDTANQRAYVLNPTGTTVLAEITGAGSPEGEFTGMAYPYLAVDQSDGNVLVNDIPGHGVIDEFDPSGHFVSQIGPSFGGSLALEESEPSDIAVDRGAESPNAGTVYVTSGNNVWAFGPLSYVTQLPLTVKKTGPGKGTVISSPAAISCGPACEETTAEFAEGETVILEAAPQAGSSFAGWGGAGAQAAGCDETGVTVTCEVTIEGATTIEANFRPLPNFELTIEKEDLGEPAEAGGMVMSAPAGISCGPGCGEEGAEFYEGQTVTLTASPNPGSHFSGWQVSGSSTSTCAGSVSPCTVTVESAAITVMATFTQYIFPLSVQRVGNGTGLVASRDGAIACGSECAARYEVGETVEVETQAGGPESEFAGWEANGASATTCTGTASPCTVTVESGLTLVAKFALVTHTLAVSVVGDGAVECKVGLGGYGPCGARYPIGETVLLRPAPGAHQTFAGWSGFAGSATVTQPCEGAVAECEVVMTGDVGGSASFVPVMDTLSVVKSGSGSGTVTGSRPGIDCGPSCAASYEDGSAIGLSARPAAGSEFVGWSGAGCTGAGNCTVALAGATQVIAQFRAAEPTAEHFAPSSSFKVRSARVAANGTVATLKLSVTSAGTVVATGHQLAKAKVKAKGAGVVSLRLKLTGAGRRLLGGKGRVRVRVRVVFTANGGSASTRTPTVTFKSVHARAGRHG